MQYRLPASTPVTWLEDGVLRVGGVARAVTLPDLHTTHELISEARTGASPEFLRRLTAAADVPDSLVTALLRVCDPVPDAPWRRATVLVRTPASAHAFARRIAGEFARMGHCATIAGPDELPEDSPRLIVEVTERVLSPRRYHPLLVRNLPHLVVARDDDGVIVGPLVLPGQTPCLRCDELHTLEGDTMWIATATQLAGLPAARPPLEVEWLATLAATTAVSQYLQGVAPLPGYALTFTREHVTAIRREVLPVKFHAECGCRTLPATETAAFRHARMSDAAELVLA